jgi:hypothetical protein
MKTVVGTYDNIQTAYAVANDLISAGYSRNDISVVASDAKNEYAPYTEANYVDSTDDVAKGAGIGAAIGGLGGLLVGLGALAIPGVGPVIAAGPLLAALTGAGVGAVTGGIVGALVDLGIPDDKPIFTLRVYVEVMFSSSPRCLMPAQMLSPASWSAQVSSIFNVKQTHGVLAGGSPLTLNETRPSLVVACKGAPRTLG